MKKDRRIIDSYETDYSGQKITVQVVKPKNKVVQKNRPRNVTSCPECNSTLILNNLGVWECTGDQIKQWDSQFRKYARLDEDGKVEYLKSVSDTGRFEYLFGRWEYSQELEEVSFDCGYSNRIHLPLPDSKSRLPDPLFVKHVETKIGRPLSEEEKWGEHDLWFFQGQYFTKYRKNARKVRIPIITLPDDVLTRGGV